MPEPKFKGETINIGGRDFVVPSLSVGRAMEVWPQLIGLDKTEITLEALPSRWAEAMKIIHSALTRNYPELTMEELSEIVAPMDIPVLLLAVAKQSGLSSGVRKGETNPAATVQ